VTTPKPPGRKPNSAREVDDALAHTAVRQQFTSEDEQGHGDQDERLNTTDKRQENRFQRIREALRPDHADRRRQQREHQRHAGECDDEKDGEQCQREHQADP